MMPTNLQEWLYPLWASFVTLIALFALTKLMGKRQISQLSFFDYIIGITIGSIASEATVDPNTFYNGMVGMFIYGGSALLISIGTCKHMWLRRFVGGKSMVLYENGIIYEKNLLKSRLDIGEFLMECRYGGHFDISKLHTVILEPNGKLSFIPIAGERSAVASDLNLKPEQDRPLANVILDGNVMQENLRHTGNNETWLKKQLRAQNTKVEDVFLATCDSNNKLNIYKKNGKSQLRDIFS